MNEKTAAKRAWVERQRKEGKPTIPSTIGEEHETSPFMRGAFASSCAIDTLSGASGDADAAERVMFLRTDKSGGGWKERIKQKL